MRFETCQLCTQLYEEKEIKLGICLDCWDNIENGKDPTITKYLGLDFSYLY